MMKPAALLLPQPPKGGGWLRRTLVHLYPVHRVCSKPAVVAGVFINQFNSITGQPRLKYGVLLKAQ